MMIDELVRIVFVKLKIVVAALAFGIMIMYTFSKQPSEWKNE